MAFFFASEINRRSLNEDSFCQMEIRMNDEAAVHAMVVADGMGGLSGGKYYSETAVNLWYQALLKTMMNENFRGNPLARQIEILTDFSKDIYGKLGQKLYKNGLDAGMKGGTTLSTVIHFWDTVIVSNCGDSPVYRIKDGEIFLVSEIQNVAGKLLQEGKITSGSVLYYQNKNRLLNYLGKREMEEAQCAILPKSEVDAILIGSDGAFGDLTKEEIQDVVNQAEKPQQVIRNLFDRSREKGEEDNQTAIFYLLEKKRTEKKESFLREQPIKDHLVGKPAGGKKPPRQATENDCCYTRIPKKKKQSSLKEKLRKNGLVRGWWL